MSTEHVVVPTEPCPNRPDGTTLGPLVCVTKDGDECRGCLDNGRRALLDQAVRGGEGVRVLCDSVYRDPIGGWWDCDLTFRHDGNHDSTEFTWTDADAWKPEEAS